MWKSSGSTSYFSRQSHAFPHCLDGAPQHEVVRNFYRHGRQRIGAGAEQPFTENLQQRHNAIDRRRGAAGDQAQLPLGCPIRPAEDGTGQQYLTALGMRGHQPLHDRDAVGPANHMDGPGRQRIAQTPGTARDLRQERVVRQHANDQGSVPAQIRDTTRNVRAAIAQRCRLTGVSVVNAQ